MALRAREALEPAPIARVARHRDADARREPMVRDLVAVRVGVSHGMERQETTWRGAALARTGTARAPSGVPRGRPTWPPGRAVCGPVQPGSHMTGPMPLLSRLADRLFGPFERALRPLDAPVAPVPEGVGALGLVWHFARLFRRQLVVVGALTVASGLINLVVLWGLAFVVDGVTTLGPAGFLEAHARTLAGLALLLGVVEPVLAFASAAYLSQAVGVSLPAAMRWQGHLAVERQDLAFFEDTFAGQVASRLAQVTGAVRREMLLAVQTLPRTAIQFAGSAALLAALAPPLAVPVVAWIALNAGLAWAVVPLYTRLSKRVAAASSRATGAMTDVYGGIRAVKLFAAEGTEAGAVRDVIADTVETQHAESRAFVATDTAVDLLNTALLLSTFAVGLWGMTAGAVTLGEFVAAVAVVRTLAGSSRAFIGLGQSVSRGLGTIRDAMPIMTTRPAVTDRPGAPELAVERGEVVFDGVRYGYRADRPVIRGLDLRVAPGERVGLVGPSGAGKSTLVALLLRLRDVDAGRVLVDGMDVRDVTQASLRRGVAVVTQDVDLLHRSVRDNVRYGRPGASDADVRRALRLAQAEGFVDELVDGAGRRGLDAHVGERGVKLSGGQRQRLTIARALLKDAPILVLDEATSALDSEAEALIRDALEAAARGRTVLAIAHRLSTIAAMDRLVVLDGGRVAEQGTHAELVAARGLYARLWARQSGGVLDPVRAA